MKIFRRDTLHLVFVAVLLLSILALFSSVFIQEAGSTVALILDKGISSQTRDEMLAFGCIYLGIATVNYVYVCVSEYLIAAVGRDLATGIFSRSLAKKSLHYSADNNTRIETLLSAGLSNLDSYVSRPVLSLFQSSTVIIASVIGILQVSLRAIYIIVPLALIVLIVCRLASKKAGDYSGIILRAQENHFIYVKSAVNMLSQLALSKDSGRYSSERLLELDSRKRTAAAKASVLSQSPKATIEILIGMGVIGTSVYLRYGGDTGTNMASVVGASVAFVYRCLPAVPSLLRSFLVIFSFRETLRAIRDSLLVKNSGIFESSYVEISRLPQDVILNANDIEIRFQSGRSLFLRKFCLPHRSLLRVKGASGSGKSTLMKYLAGADSASGNISSSGVVLNEKIISQAKRAEQERVHQYYLPQASLMLPTSIEDNIILCGQDRKNHERYDSVVSELRLESIISVPLDFYSDNVRDWSKNLSGGQIQLVAVARLAYCYPLIAYLDESFSAMDPLLSLTTIRALRLLCPETTFVLTTHDESFSYHADEVIDLGG